MRHGAYDYLLKPIDLQKLDHVINEALNVSRLMREPATIVPTGTETPPDEELPGEAIIGCCPAMQEAYKGAIGRVGRRPDLPGADHLGRAAPARRSSPAPSTSTVLAAPGPVPGPQLRGDSGQLAGERAFRPREGRFTRRPTAAASGKFEQVSGGTLFLDEIGDMPPAIQAKMLRVLQEQAFERVGGNETIRTDVRLIAATHRDLKAWSEEGKFRPDLYYRLGVFTIHLPPLRERDDDLLMLVRYYLRRFNRELGREVREITPEGLERLRGYPWPGNVRELQSVLKQALLKASGPVLLPAFLPDLQESGVRSQESEKSASLTPDSCSLTPGLETFVIRQRVGSDGRDLYAETHRELDRQLLSRVLEFTHGNLQQAALLLGIARQTLRLKLRDLQEAVHCAPGEPEEDDPG